MAHLRRTALRSALLSWCWIICAMAAANLGAEENEGFGGQKLPSNPPAADGDDKRTVPVKAKPAAKPPVTNDSARANFKAWCAAQNLTTRLITSDNVVMELVGNATLADAEAIVKQSNEAIKGLDLWTGSQGIFLSNGKDQLKYWLVVMPDGGMFDRYVDHARKGQTVAGDGEDLTKKLKHFNSDRWHLSIIDKYTKAGPLNLGVYFASSAAVDAFYRPYLENPNEQAPAWLREGIQSELQRLVCKRITCITIAYEMNDPAGLTNNWGRDMKTYITGAADKYKGKLLPAHHVMMLDLIRLDAVQYRQMWSWCGYVRSLCGNVRGETNKFFQLLKLTATGDSSDSAMIKLFKLQDPAMSQAWVSWALQQRD